MTPTDPLFSEQWAWEATNAGRGLDAWTGNADKVVIAVLDSGIPMEAGNLSHPDLNDTSRFFPGRDLINKDDDPADDHGHGTHVTGIIAAAMNNGTGVAGVWPGPVLTIKVFDRFNEGSNETFKDGVIAAVSFAKARNARLVINYSGGGPESSVKREAVEHARDNGALLVSAAGNENGGGILHPAAYSPQFSNVLAVGAVNKNLKRPSFASQGPEMSVVAPGEDILSTLPNYFANINNFGKQTKYDRLNGTSQAAPMVSALAALIWAEKPNLSAQQVRDKIVSTADPIAGSANDFGSGIINMGRALQ